jgi:exodeoxyribonuclease-5
LSTRWSPQQEQALKDVSRWFSSTRERKPEGQVFRLFGYAGTGKTTLARHLAEGVEGNVVFAAFTGKAALVMRARGCVDARTIHSLIYRPKEIESEEPSFVLNDDSEAAQAKLIIVDECSMVDEELGRDLLSFGRPVLVLGDPAQLPPVKGGGFFTEAEPDCMLTEVHRQAADNPIIRMSMQVRDGGRLSVGEFGDSRVIRRDSVDAGAVTRADQVLVGLNRTRRLYNRRIRELFGHTGTAPEVGDKLVCLRNDRTKGLLNGGIWKVKSATGLSRGKLRMTVVPEDDLARKPQRIGVVPQFFESEEEVPFAIRKTSDEFDFGYALTVHKAQGSQWNEVVLFDESYAFREHRSRWLYTAVTRAAERLTVVI